MAGPEGSIPARFEARVRRSPDRLAVASPRVRWTYRDLNREANRIARALFESPGGRRQPAGLVFAEEEMAIAGLLGAMKAGRIAVPLDSSQPAERLREVVARSGATVLAADARTRDLSERIRGNAAIAEVDRFAPGPDEDLPLETGPSDPAFVLFTSGSTGEPKGVLQNHGNVLDATDAQCRELGISEQDRILLLGSTAFGATVGTVYPAIFQGASLHPYRVEVGGVAGLADWIRNERITIYHSVPAVFRELARFLPPDGFFPDVRLVRVSGDAILSRDVEIWRSHFADTSRFRVNLAMTETGTICSRLLDFHTPIPEGAVPTGSPVEGIEVEIWDETGRPAPPGEPGEIIVASRRLVPEYWRDPVLTAERFLPDPDGGDLRRFRTGDLGRWNPEGGGLEHLGRKDFQVKIRGVRVSPAEVESALLCIPGVQDAAVVARPDASGDLRLSAFVIAEEERILSRTDLRRHLRARLPDALVPAAYVFLRTLPRTANGKPDRTALPAPGPDDFGDGGTSRKPVGPEEVGLLEIWRRVLPGRVEGVGDSFFDLGGDSLLAARMLAEVERIFGVRLALPVLLEASTIEALAKVVARPSEASRSRSPLVAIRSGGSNLPIFCVPGGNGPGFNYRALASLLGDDQPFYAFHVATEVGEETPETIEGWADRFLPELKSVQPRGPYRLGGHSFGGTVAYEIAHRLISDGERVQFLALFDTFAPGYPRPLTAAERRKQVWSEFLERPVEEKIRTLGRTLARRTRRLFFTPRPPDSPMFGDGALGRVLRRYLHPPLPASLVLFRAAEREHWRGFSFEEPTNGWAELAGDRLRVHTVPGKHGDLIVAGGIGEIARILRGYLIVTAQAG